MSKNFPRPSEFHKYPPRRGPDECVRCGETRTNLTPDHVSAYSDMCARCWSEADEGDRRESARRVSVPTRTTENPES